MSNRLPVSVVKHREGPRFVSSAGGLATALRGSFGSEPSLWIGWPGVAAERLSPGDQDAVARHLVGERCHPVFLDQSAVEGFYLGFSNQALWPLAHYFTQSAVYDERHWQAYVAANRRYCDAVLEVARPGDVIWVHDYHLMLLPAMLRERLPATPIGFFLHIPFPAYEVFRQLPWRREILEGLLGADLIGLHTQDYVLHFRDCVNRLTDAEYRLGAVRAGRRAVQVGAFPLGIDYDAFAAAAGASVAESSQKLRGPLGERRMILSLDRLDYSKGIPRRLEAFGRFLEAHPEHRERVTLVTVAVPSREGVPAYQALKRQVHERVTEINGRHGTLGWVPIWYLHRSVPFHTLVALYRLADVALVTPLRDGMNLIAKEYVASQTDGRGVLVLSEMAGAAEELTGALVVNPYNVDEMADAIHTALTMSEGERVGRNRAMQLRLREATAAHWASRFIAELARTAPAPAGV